ncbi:hypothetical protein GGR54DRAFT_463087 [Hypoxylon sp. NC1633]|nr:hypothetical protein GGR54DRAFT_463087 [Hypoxylon sp. NC1633]
MPWSCRDCNRSFATRHAINQHTNALGHELLTFECHMCYNKYSSDNVRRNHKVEDHFFCVDCDREFMNYNAIKMHLNSRTHRGSDGIQCPFCRKGHATATGLAHHLESGSCPNAQSLNRDELYKAVRSRDPNGAITKKLIGWHGSPTYEATERTWNGQAFECYFCHRNFNHLSSLNQHLSSPAHQQALYHCPNRNGCGRDFKSLAAVMNHLESESCSYMRFENVQKSVGNIISGNRLLTFG